MKTVKCGNLGLSVSRLGLGCMGMSSTYGEAHDAQSIQALQAALESEITFWDTADVYGNGSNEELLAQVLVGSRDQVVLATKCGITGRNSDGLNINGRPDYIKKSCEASLRRLKVDVIDLYYLHRVDPDVPVEDSVGAMGELVSRGLVRFVGLSEAGPESIKRAHSEYPLSAVQSEYSLFTREVESEVLPLLKELKIALVAYSPLGRGVLTGTIVDGSEIAADDFRRQLPRFEEANLKKNQRLVERVKAVAKARECTAAQVALAWLLHRQGVIPIPGTRQAKYVLENAEACRIQLTENELEALDFAPKSVAGDRYPAILAKAVGR